MTRLLGIDLGERRVGVAVGDDADQTARPLTTFRRGSIQDDAAVVARLAAEQRASGLVVGLPLDMRGTEGPQAQRSRAWGSAIARQTGLSLAWRDERLTTEAAESALGPVQLPRGADAPTRSAIRARRNRVDRDAAARILQAELDARAGMRA